LTAPALDGEFSDLGLCRPGHAAADILDLGGESCDRVSATGGSEDHRDFAAAQVAHLLFRRSLHVDAGKHPTLGNFPALIENRITA